MSRYYLLAQLPTLDFVPDGAPLPISEERFSELCAQFLKGKLLRTLEGLTLDVPREPEPTGIPLVDGWYECERELRLALETVRLARRGKLPEPDSRTNPTEADLAAREAASLSDPLEAERLLLRYRLAALDALRPSDPFSDAMLFHYGLRLKLLTRIRAFDAARGRESYRKIYDSILRGGETEVNP